MKNRSDAILTGPIQSTIVRLTIPSIIGMLGLMIFNVVDTYFVGRLGAVELAAISFTFPVIMVINSLVFGIGTGAMALFSRAVGNRNIKEERLLATSSLLLGVVLSIIVGIIGYFTIVPLFRLLGAGDDLMPYITSYMQIWYLGSAFMMIPMLGDSILRGLGDTFTPALVMLTTAILNAVLDPVLIFGMGPFPEMGMAGAALATVFARAIAAGISILIQIFREQLIIVRGLTAAGVWRTWKELFHIGLPNAAIKAIMPLGAAVFTAILAGYGNEEVAGFGVAVKIEGVILAVLGAFAVTAAVFVGQNLGAKNKDRIKRGINGMRLVVHVAGVVAAVVLFFFGEPLAALFTDNPQVLETATAYLKIVPIGYGLFAASQIGASVLSVYKKAYLAGGLSLVQIVVVAIPLAYLLSVPLGANGVFTAILGSFFVVGALTFAAVTRESKAIFRRM